jgi:hypothetical protein
LLVVGLAVVIIVDNAPIPRPVPAALRDRNEPETVGSTLVIEKNQTLSLEG